MRHHRTSREDRRVRRLLEGPRHPRARAVASEWWSLVVQLAAFGVVCYGIALESVSAALIIAGVVVIAAFEIPRSARGKTNAVRGTRASR